MNTTHKWPFADAIVVDWSWALINAVLMQWNFTGIKNHLDFCFEYAESGAVTEEDFTILLTCWAHIQRRVSEEVRRQFPKNDEIKQYFLE